ncbi:MAG: hypothetical protein AB7S38_32540, partial [Vulcanimicrobiota bacterium]
MDIGRNAALFQSWVAGRPNRLPDAGSPNAALAEVVRLALAIGQIAERLALALASGVERLDAGGFVELTTGLALTTPAEMAVCLELAGARVAERLVLALASGMERLDAGGFVELTTGLALTTPTDMAVCLELAGARVAERLVLALAFALAGMERLDAGGFVELTTGLALTTPADMAVCLELAGARVAERLVLALASGVERLDAGGFVELATALALAASADKMAGGLASAKVTEGLSASLAFAVAPCLERLATSLALAASRAVLAKEPAAAEIVAIRPELATAAEVAEGFAVALATTGGLADSTSLTLTTAKVTPRLSAALAVVAENPAAAEILVGGLVVASAAEVAERPAASGLVGKLLRAGIAELRPAKACAATGGFTNVALATAKVTPRLTAALAVVAENPGAAEILVGGLVVASAAEVAERPTAFGLVGKLLRAGIAELVPAKASAAVEGLAITAGPALAATKVTTRTSLADLSTDVRPLAATGRFTNVAGLTQATAKVAPRLSAALAVVTQNPASAEILVGRLVVASAAEV